MRAYVLAADERRSSGRRRPGLRLTHRTQLQRAQRREATCSKTGSAQKAAAVEASVRLIWQSAGEASPARLTFHPFDQHGGPLLRGIAIDAGEGLHLRRVRLVARFTLLIVGLTGGRSLLGDRPGCSCRDTGACAERPEEVAPSNLFFRFHCAHSLVHILTGFPPSRVTRRVRKLCSLSP